MPSTPVSGRSSAERGHKITGGAELHATSEGRRIPRGGGPVTDGPFAEVTEQVGGFYQVETDDLDDLLECCRSSPPSVTASRSAGGQARGPRVVRYVVLIAYEPGRWDEADEAVRQEYFDAHHAFERYVDEHGRATRQRGAERRRPGDDDPARRRRVGRRHRRAVRRARPSRSAATTTSSCPTSTTAIAAARLLPRAYTARDPSVVGVEGYESR